MAFYIAFTVSVHSDNERVAFSNTVDFSNFKNIVLVP